MAAHRDGSRDGIVQALRLHSTGILRQAGSAACCKWSPIAPALRPPVSGSTLLRPQCGPHLSTMNTSPLAAAPASVTVSTVSSSRPAGAGSAGGARVAAVPAGLSPAASGESSLVWRGEGMGKEGSNLKGEERGVYVCVLQTRS